MKFRIHVALIGLVLIIMVSPIFAHANLLRSTPAANSTVETSPSEIILNFSEPLEPQFSRFTLRDTSGETVATPDSRVDPGDVTRLVMQPGELPDGLYTVVWQSVSAADGHATRGTFAFGIGVTVPAGSTDVSAASAIDEQINPVSTGIRWFNYLSLALIAGSLGFGLFVWDAVGQQNTASARPLQQGLTRLIWFGWSLTGIAGLLVLLLQTSIATDTGLMAVISTPDRLLTMIIGTTYGILWLVRTGCWLLAGVALYCYGLRRGHSVFWRWLAGLLIIGLLLTVSLFSHASGAQDHFAAVAGDWLHLTASTIWTGGLVAFIYTLIRLRREPDNVSTVERITDAFSNFARVCVVALLISGTYAAWLHVGTVEALTTTTYGRALLIKLILFVPLLAIAGVNLILTAHGLRNGQTVWVGRLRGLVSAEIALTVGILAAVGVMTAVIPARNVVAIRDANAESAPLAPFFAMEIVDNQMFHLEIEPGYVGKNTFTISGFDADGKPIEDASMIRLRFTNLDDNIGQSELRPDVSTGVDGIYSTEGDNLSTPGNYRIRMNLQRPGQFDTVVDFSANIRPMPAPPAPVVDTSIPLSIRLPVTLAFGLMLVGMGGFFLPRRILSGVGIMSAVMMAAGLIFLITAGSQYIARNTPGDLVITDAFARPALRGDTGSVYLNLQNNTGHTERLVSITTDAAARVEIHQTVVENDLARMVPVDGIDIPAGQTLNIEPGGYHLMLIDLHNTLGEGGMIFLNLKFDSGKELTAIVNVRNS